MMQVSFLFVIILSLNVPSIKTQSESSFRLVDRCQPSACSTARTKISRSGHTMASCSFSHAFAPLQYTLPLAQTGRCYSSGHWVRSPCRSSPQQEWFMNRTRRTECRLKSSTARNFAMIWSPCGWILVVRDADGDVQKSSIRQTRVFLTEYGVIWWREFFLPLLMIGYWQKAIVELCWWWEK